MSDWLTKEECAAFYDAMTNPTKTFWLGVEKERQQNRAAAFGAIRRAAEIARELDAAKIEYRNADDWMDAVCCEWRAYSVRLAIRAAIGSEKA